MEQKRSWLFRSSGGIRHTRDGTVYSVAGDADRAVRIEWVDKRGNDEIARVVTSSAPQLAAAIEEARAGLESGGDPSGASG